MMRGLLVAAAIAAMPALASAAPQLDAVARSPHGRVVVVAESGLDSTAERLAESAESTLARIRLDLPELPVPDHIEVRLVQDAKDLIAVAPEGRGAPSWAIGVAYPDLGIISVAMQRGAHPVDAEQTLRHELGHMALGAALGDRAPHWLHEGFAYQHSAEWSWARTETLAGMAWFSNIIPLAQLDRAFPAEEIPANQAYAESYDFVGFLSRRGRWEDSSDDGDRAPFRRFLNEIGKGADPDTAAVRAFGRPLKVLFDEWKDDLNSRFKFMPIGLFGLAMWVMMALLVVLAWWVRRRRNRARLAQWDLEDAARREREQAERGSAPAQVIAPPYIPWPGEDPLDEPEDDDKPDEPRWIN